MTDISTGQENLIFVVPGLSRHPTPNFALDYQNIPIEGITEPQLFVYNPQEIIVILNIVEESFYAQSRPNILRIILVKKQENVSGYNFIEFQEPDNVKISINQIHDIEIKIVTRKGELVSFANENDVKIQLEFKEET